MREMRDSACMLAGFILIFNIKLGPRQIEVEVVEPIK